MKNQKTPKTQILLLDDDPDFQKLTTLSLWIHSIKLFIASNLVEAKNAITQKAIDAALIEIALPNMQGFQFLNWIISENKNRIIPIIAITSLKNTEIKDQAMELGVHKVLFKPIPEKTMIQSIHEVIGK